MSVPLGPETASDHGAFTPNSMHRAQVTKAGRGLSARRSEDRTPAERRAAMTWVQRLKRVFKSKIDLRAPPT